MSRITVVLFHLVLTASVTVWANSERQELRAGQKSSEDLVVTDQAAGTIGAPLQAEQAVSAAVHPVPQAESQTSNPEQERLTEPSI